MAMDVTSSGKEAIKLITKNTTVQINPTGDAKADALLFTKGEAKSGEIIYFNSPGEYEVSGVMMDGIGLGEGNTAFSVGSEELKLAYVAGKVTELSDKQVEAFGNVDVLIVALDDQPGSAIVKLINQLEPRVVVPIDYTPDALAAFIKEVGHEPEKLDRLKISKKDLPEDKQKLILLGS